MRGMWKTLALGMDVSLVIVEGRVDGLHIYLRP
jgi:hypothetical protein